MAVLGVNDELLAILACPACDARPPVRADEEANALVCDACGRHYPVRDGIPVMLVDEAVIPEKNEKDS